ncbi:hypothetical protein NPX13_g8089 [Xylaria arbuscula]|uniref:Dihydroxy-acid/6-phosphogluconate dehydratase N-terminal domain-containing protein n=1 Tax=Xylaria arbuscula TaxID=114810 RepID=A0A9W8TKH8_9PEZI|nr:hypothetical protein NPX13_g8089 [Xylaria arbuscula]
MACDSDCNDCTATCSSKPPVDIEDYKAETHRLQALVKELQDKLSAQTLDSSSTATPEDAAAGKARLRSAAWFDRPDDRSMQTLYIERYLNYGMTKEELLSGKPVIGIAQSGSDIAPCNRHHQVLAKRVREGIRSAGGIAFEFPTHPIQETSRRPTATLDRNLAYLGLVELLYAYPFDGVVLLTGCDKTTPACLMAAATMNIPAICLNVGPMLNGWTRGERMGSGTVVWQAREQHAAGLINDDQVTDMVAAGTPSAMALPGAAAIPAPYRERAQMAYKTGERIVDMVHEDLRPSKIMTRKAFENAIVVNTAIGGSTNAPIHLNAIAKHIGVPLDLDDWDRIGFEVPLLLNMMPAGEMLGEDYYRAGGLPAVLAELLEANALPHPDAITANGRSMGENAQGKKTWDKNTIRPFSGPLMDNAGVSGGVPRESGRP